MAPATQPVNMPARRREHQMGFSPHCRGQESSCLGWGLAPGSSCLGRGLAPGAATWSRMGNMDKGVGVTVGRQLVFLGSVCTPTP